MTAAKAYVAGPFRAKNHWEIAQNIRAAETIALACWRLGLATYCPHSSTAHFQAPLLIRSGSTATSPGWT